MSQNSGDLRVKRTHKLLREALIALIEERGFDAITVGEIASRAMVSRAAFYRYYQDKYDLAERIFEDLIHTLLNEFDPLRYEALHSSAPQPTSDFWGAFFEQAMHSTPPSAPWERLFEHVARHERFYLALLGRHGGSWFGAKMRTYLAEVINRRLQTLHLQRKRLADQRFFADGFVATLLAAMLVDAIIWWLEQNRPYSLKQAATYCSQLTYAILKEATLWE
jgi:AcrR family transcriptional regulator